MGYVWPSSSSFQRPQRIPDLSFRDFRYLHCTPDRHGRRFSVGIIEAELSKVIIQIHQTAVVQSHSTRGATSLRQCVHSFPSGPTSFRCCHIIDPVFRDDVRSSFVNVSKPMEETNFLQKST